MSAGRKKGGFATFLLVVLACVCVAGIGYSGYRIYAIRAEYKKGERLYEDIRGMVEGKQGGAAAALGGTADVEAAAQTGDGMTDPTGAAPEVAQSVLDFGALRAVNGDAVAWIAIPNTKIDYPVVQGEDNVYYLDRLFTGVRGSVGSIFMERTNAPDFSDRNTILFGHHMRDGSMFAGLDKYRTQEYYEAHPTMTLYTPQGDFAVEIFAGFATTAQPLPTAFETEDAFLEYVSDARVRSNFTSGVEVAPGDRILTLCTCSYVSDDARYILMGVIR